MRRKIFYFSAILAGISVLLTSILVTNATYNDFYKTLKREVAAEASYLSSGLALSGMDYLNHVETQLGHRLTLISSDGTVLYDSVSNPALMDNHLSRPEVQAALTSGSGESTRDSDTLRERTYYYALLMDDGSVFRISSATSTVLASYDRLFGLVVLVTISGFLFAALIASFTTKKIMHSINTIDLDHPEQNETYEEIVPLLTRINTQRNQIQQQLEELRRQREEFVAVTDNMKEGLLILEGNGTILSYNKSALKLLNTPISDPSGMNIFSLNRSNHLREILYDTLNDTSSERVIPLGNHHCQIFTSTVTNTDGVQGLIMILMDVTEKEEREKLRREFTANVSHELKTPLTAISGYAEIIMNGVAKSEDIPEFSQSIYHESQRLIALVQDLMYLSKLEEQTAFPTETVDLLVLSNQAVKRLSQKAEKHGVSLSISGAPTKILGIPSVLQEMIDNLLDNAIKYNRHGGSATITIQKGNNNTIVQVSDNGIGIPQSEQLRVFERFYRVDKSHNKGIDGTGLGLAIVKHGALLHGASVEVESSDTGSVFSIIFPS